MTSPKSAESQLLAEHLERCAGDYFPPLAGKRVRVKLVHFHQRRYSLGYEFDITSDETRRGVFVKMPIASAAQQGLEGNAAPPVDRPRLVPLLPVAMEAEHEYTALLAMESHFGTVNDERTGAPRVLDRLHTGAIIVEAICLPTLAGRLRDSHRWNIKTGQAPLGVSFQNAGRWLRTFHEMPPVSASVARISTRDAFMAQFMEFVEYVRRTGDDSRLLNEIVPQVARRAEETLPSGLELATGHSDFGLHNLFADNAGNVIGFDTLAHWRTSPFEDIAYFLTLLETPPPLFVPRGVVCRRELMVKLRGAFLQGYFRDERVPMSEIHLFSILIAMEKLVSAVHSSRQVKRVPNLAKRARLLLQKNLIIHRIRSILGKLSSLEKGVVAMGNSRLDRPSWEQAS